MENNYLIPANANKGKLIMGLFRPIDAMIFGIGCGITLVGLFALQNLLTQISVAILVMLPALITGFLVIPIPYQHNILVFLQCMKQFLKEKQTCTYVWKGWCAERGEEERKR
jgi:hypothetical protein